jgi:hypothetical protein
MTQDDADHAGAALVAVLAQVPGVAVRQLGCTPDDDGRMSYGLGLKLPDGRELLLDVEDISSPAAGKGDGPGAR